MIDSTFSIPESKADVASRIRIALRAAFDAPAVEIDAVTATYIRVRIATGDTKQPFTYYHIRVSHSGA